MLSTRTAFLRSIAIGLSLASASLALANGAAPTTTRVDAHRGVLQEGLKLREGLDQLLSNPVTPNLKTLLDHQQRFVSRGAPLEIGTRNGAKLELREGAVFVVHSGGASRKADAHDLLMLGIDGRETYDKMVMARLHEVAGVEMMGDGAASSEAARKVFADQEQRGERLVAKMANVAFHPGLKTLGDYARAAVPAPERTGFALSVRDDGEVLRLDRKAVRKVKGDKSFPVSFSDLKRHGLDSEEKLQTAVARRVLELAQLSGDPGDAALLAKAHGILQANIDNPSLLKNVLAAPTSDANVRLLLTYHQAVIVPNGQSKEAPYLAGTRGGDALFLGERMSARRAGHTGFAKFTDLAQHGIHSIADFDRLVARQLVTMAGVEGDPSDPMVVQRARDQLRHELRTAAAEVATMGKFIDAPAGVAGSPASSPVEEDLILLKKHDVMVSRQKGLTNEEFYLTGTVGGDALQVGGWMTSRFNGHISKATLEDLARHGMRTPADIARVVAQRLATIAGVAGDPSDPIVRQEARAVLEQEILDLAPLQAFILNPVSQSDVALIRSIHARMPPKDDRTIVLTSGTDSLVVKVVKNWELTNVSTVDQWNRPLVQRMYGWVEHERVLVITPKEPKGRPATLADLHRLGVGTKAKLDAAIAASLLHLAKEDIL